MSREPVSLGEVLLECRAMIEPQAHKRGIAMAFPQFDLPTYVNADRTRIKQVLINLLSNAIKYNRAGGQAMIEAMALQGRVLIIVSDTGQGMSAEQIAHLFEPFNRLGAERTSIEGTGIGLVIVKRLLDLMDGRVEVSSNAGEGSSFRVWLPMAPRPALQQEPSERGARAVFSGFEDINVYNRTVLYAEDNMINVELLRQVMRMRPLIT